MMPEELNERHELVIVGSVLLPTLSRSFHLPVAVTDGTLTENPPIGTSC